MSGRRRASPREDDFDMASKSGEIPESRTPPTVPCIICSKEVPGYLTGVGDRHEHYKSNELHCGTVQIKE